MADIEGDSPATVLDLPQLHNKPSAATILSVLAQVAQTRSPFGSEQATTSLKIKEDGLPAYLTRLISSPLSWLPSDSDREEVWEAASQRLSERSGRMAMGSILRVFKVCDLGVRRDGKAPRYLGIKLNEPSLTDDNVGHKTWVGSFLLAKQLPDLMAKHLPGLLPPSTRSLESSSSPGSSESPTTPNSGHLDCSDAGNSASSSPSTSPSPLTSVSPPFTSVKSAPPSPSLVQPRVRILELGSGTGLTGMAAAAIFPSSTCTHLTDLPSILSNLIKNVTSNAHLFASNPPTTGVLDWNDLPDHVDPAERYDCILAADSLYAPQHPDWLTNAMAIYLKREKGARILTELPHRDMERDYHDLLRKAMMKRGFAIIEQGEEWGYDDWEGDWCQKMPVQCWWSVWGWADGTIQ